ncbi:flagellar hook-length control protein FliK [Catenovulum sediminis]|uniref:flagellar hook-length control protein FliK n=1 Tax=Catenovulum sediminis TaxID=1740262 RepID=UPI00117D91BE|nr:flagellar hook-length control protein FliK [Catenovulum sediminis]
MQYIANIPSNIAANVTIEQKRTAAEQTKKATQSTDKGFEAYIYQQHEKNLRQNETQNRKPQNTEKTVEPSASQLKSNNENSAARKADNQTQATKSQQIDAGAVNSEKTDKTATRKQPQNDVNDAKSDTKGIDKESNTKESHTRESSLKENTLKENRALENSLEQSLSTDRHIKNDAKVQGMDTRLIHSDVKKTAEAVATAAGQKQVNDGQKSEESFDLLSFLNKSNSAKVSSSKSAEKPLANEDKNSLDKVDLSTKAQSPAKEGKLGADDILQQVLINPDATQKNASTAAKEESLGGKTGVESLSNRQIKEGMSPKPQNGLDDLLGKGPLKSELNTQKENNGAVAGNPDKALAGGKANTAAIQTQAGEVKAKGQTLIDGKAVNAELAANEKVNSAAVADVAKDAGEKDQAALNANATHKQISEKSQQIAENGLAKASESKTNKKISDELMNQTGVNQTSLTAESKKASAVEAEKPVSTQPLVDKRVNSQTGTQHSLTEKADLGAVEKSLVEGITNDKGSPKGSQEAARSTTAIKETAAIKETTADKNKSAAATSPDVDKTVATAFASAEFQAESIVSEQPAADGKQEVQNKYSGNDKTLLTTKNNEGSDKTVVSKFAESQKLNKSETDAQQEHVKPLETESIIGEQVLGEQLHAEVTQKVNEQKAAADTRVQNTQFTHQQVQHKQESIQAEKVADKQNQMTQLKEQIQLHKPEGATALNDAVKYMMNGRIQAAEIRLDPPELGSMQIKISLNGDQASVSMLVQNPQAKEMLEQTMPKLKEMLEQQGLQMGEANVSQKQEGKEQNASQSGNGGAGGNGQGNGDADESGDEQLVGEQKITNGHLGAVDYYA